MGDNPMSFTVSPQRKLPNPTSGANANSALKGILIKPKRILPAQPDNQKLKRIIQDPGLEYKTDDSVIENTRVDFNPSSKDENGNTNSSHKVSIPKLEIDVERLKTYFKLQGKGTGINEKRKTDQNENNITEDTVESLVGEIHTNRQPRGEFGTAYGAGVNRENNLCGYHTDGLTKVKEWCSGSDTCRMTAKMATDPSVAKSLDRSIRSPSPKSNTTWDRSSSGYSSDERADPRSPPPTHSASVSVSSKAETEITNDDDVSVSNTTGTGDNPNDTEPDDIDTENCKNESDSYENKTLTSENNASSDTLVSLAGYESDKSTLVNENLSASCDQCETNNNETNNIGAEKVDTTNSCVNLSFDNVSGNKQIPKRPSWTAHSPLPGNGRLIQYRKSGSESLISLRHPNRQGSVESNFGGLEVCGKSFPQPANSSSLKTDSNLMDSNEIGHRTEIVSPTSAFAPVARLVPSSEVTDTHKIDSHGQEMAARTQFLRPSLTTGRSPRDIKNLTLTSNVKLTVPHDDRDIRRTLHDLNSPRRQSPGGKSLPIRARHPLQPNSSTDTNSNQPMGASVTNSPRTVSDSGKLGMKLFSKKMWRAPPGLPENAQTRPFSPFGGTLPPAKIKEQELRKHHPDDSA